MFGGLGSAVLGRGGGESARAKGGAWKTVVEDGELVVGGSTVGRILDQGDILQGNGVSGNPQPSR